MNPRAARSFAMVEVVMATAIVGGMAVAALSLVGSVAKQKADAAHLARGQALCRSLAEEIATRPVNDWSSGPIEIELDLGILKVTGIDAKGVTITLGTGNRSAFNTVDKYNGYSESPPKDESGNTLTGYAGWGRRVKVDNVEVSTPDVVSATETGLRRVTIATSYNGKVIASTTFLRSSEWERVMP